MFFIIGISISVFLGFLLLIKKDKSRADIILAIWLIFFFIHQVFNYLFYTEEIFKYPHLLGIELPMPVIHGVLLYFYALELTGYNLPKTGYALLHFMPALSLVVLAIPFYSLSGAEKIGVFRSDGEGFEWYIMYQNVVVFVSGITYSILSLLLVRKHQSNIQESFSNIDEKELQWLMYLSIGIGVIWFLVLFFDNVIIFSGVVVFVLFIGFFGINQMNIFNTNQNQNTGQPLPIAGKVVKTKNEFPGPTTTKRYAKSGLSEEMAEQLYGLLKQKMNDEKLFKENDLTSTELAKRLNVHPNYLSQVINEKEKKNFYNYINSLRIKEFIRLASLPESKKFTMLSLAYDCGFNSKSTFNKHFKENTGKTPTEYFKAQKAEQQ